MKNQKCVLENSRETGNKVQDDYFQTHNEQTIQARNKTQIRVCVCIDIHVHACVWVTQGKETNLTSGANPST